MKRPTPEQLPPMPTRLVRCPVEDNDPGPTGPVIGCGYLFEADVTSEAFDGMVDCPSCGVCFDPDHSNNQPQPRSSCPPTINLH